MHETHLTRGNLDCFKGSHWIGNEVNPICNLLYPRFVFPYCGFLFILSSNQVMDAYCRFLQYKNNSKSKLFISPYIVMSKNYQFSCHGWMYSSVAMVV